MTEIAKKYHNDFVPHTLMGAIIVFENLRKEDKEYGGYDAKIQVSDKDAEWLKEDGFRLEEVEDKDTGEVRFKNVLKVKSSKKPKLVGRVAGEEYEGPVGQGSLINIKVGCKRVKAAGKFWLTPYINKIQVVTGVESGFDDDFDDIPADEIF